MPGFNWYDWLCTQIVRLVKPPLQRRPTPQPPSRLQRPHKDDLAVNEASRSAARKLAQGRPTLTPT